MDIGLTEPKTDAGFSLIELIIVVTVLSILTVSVGLTMSFSRLEPNPNTDIIPFQQRFDQLHAQAIYSQTPQAFQVSNIGWQPVQYDPETQSWGQNGRMTHWINAVVFNTAQSFTQGTPDIVILPTGRSTAFEIRFRQNSVITECRSDGWSGLRCSTL